MSDHPGLVVRWSRPGLDRVRKGRGRAVGLHSDGSLKIIDDDGKIRAIAGEYVERRHVTRGPRSKVDRVSWASWSDMDTAELVQYVSAPPQGDSRD